MKHRKQEAVKNFEMITLELDFKNAGFPYFTDPSRVCSSQNIYIGQLFYMQKYFTSVLIWDGRTNVMVTSLAIFYSAVLAKILSGPKLHCNVYRFITYIKISPKGTFTITTVFLFFLSVFSSKKLWNGTFFNSPINETN